MNAIAELQKNQSVSRRTYVCRHQDHSLMYGTRSNLKSAYSLVAVWIGRPTPWCRQTVHGTLRGEPGRTLGSRFGLGAVAFRQRLIDHRLDFRLGQLGVFLSKLALKGWMGGGNIALTRQSQSLASLVIQCLAFLRPLTPCRIGSGIGSRPRVHPVIKARPGTSSEQTQDENQSKSNDAAPREI